MGQLPPLRHSPGPGRGAASPSAPPTPGPALAPAPHARLIPFPSLCKETGHDALPPPVPADKFTALGKIAWLWMNSPLHRDWTIDLLSRFALPPVELGQYLLLERDGLPVAYCSWAHLSGEAELAYLLDAGNIPLADWNGGDHLWFVDWVAPFGKADSFELKNRLADKFPTSVARAHSRQTGQAQERACHGVQCGRQTDRQAARWAATGQLPRGAPARLAGAGKPMRCR